MRIAICALSAVLLSGCSWLGGINNVFTGQNNARGAHGVYGQQAAHNGNAQRNSQKNTQGQYQNFGGGFPQQPQFGQPQQVTGAYGSHAANAHQAQGTQRGTPAMRKPRLRGSLSMGFEKSVSGNILNYTSGVDTGGLGPTNPLSNYTFSQNNGFSGSPGEGLTINSDLTARATSITGPSISFDDVHSTPFRIAGGAEYILTPHTTVFANAGYSTAEGNEGGSVSVIGTAQGDVTFTGYRQNVPAGVTTIAREVENLPIAQISYDFSDMARYDLEVGGRHYFNPILGGKVARAMTPFVSASLGAAHYNGLDFKSERQNLNLHEAVTSENGDIVYVPQLNANAPISIYNSQWVGLGQLNAGLEWQATPKTAIAFETGVKFESARKYTNEVRGDSNISIPFTIRGSYNF